MPHISKQKIDKENFIKIYEDFSELMEPGKQASSKAVFSKEFFTKTEKIMFAKRLALIVLLERNIPYKDIEEYLKISSSTIFKYQKRLSKGGFENTLSLLIKKRKGINAENLAQKILDLISPNLNKLVGKERLPR